MSHFTTINLTQSFFCFPRVIGANIFKEISYKYFFDITVCFSAKLFVVIITREIYFETFNVQ